MTCDDFTPFVDAYVDQELDEQDVAEMDAHLALCDDCRKRVTGQMRFKEEFKSVLGESRAPDALRARILAGLEDIQIEVEPGSEPAQVIEIGTAKRRLQPAWIALPIAAAAALLFVLPNFTVAPAGTDSIPAIEQAVDWHQGEYPIEVKGPEAAPVSSWFRGKVGFPVRPPGFGEMPVSLIGGRIANIDDQRAAFLSYEYQGTPVSVMVFEGDGLVVPSDKVRKVANRDVAIWNQGGYEVAVMRDSGVTYTFTSALSESDFVTVVEASIAR